MNGNFEVDKSVYPYAPLYRGSAIGVHNVRTQEVTIKANLGAVVAGAVALDLNALYWARKERELVDAKENIHVKAKAVAYAQQIRGKIKPLEYAQIIFNIDKDWEEGSNVAA